MLEILSSLDLYGINFPLRYKSKTTYSTLTGKILTLLTIIIGLIVSIYLFLEFLNKKNYTLTTSKLNLSDDYKTYLKNFPIMVGIVNNEGNIYEIDNSIFSIYGVNYYYSINENNTSKIIKDEFQLEKCNYSKIKNKYIKSKFSEYYYNNLFCIPEKYKNIYLINYYNMLKNFTSIQFILKKCNNDTYNKNAKI